MAGRKRIDPISKTASGNRNHDRIGGKDPTRYYVLTNPNDEDSGTNAYLARGYVIETVRDGGPTALGGTAPGAKVTSGGQILVSCPKEQREQEEAEGQEIAEMFERRILRDGGVEDGLRGRGFEISVGRTSRYAGDEV